MKFEIYFEQMFVGSAEKIKDKYHVTFYDYRQHDPKTVVYSQEQWDEEIVSQYNVIEANKNVAQ